MAAPGPSGTRVAWDEVRAVGGGAWPTVGAQGKRPHLLGEPTADGTDTGVNVDGKRCEIQVRLRSRRFPSKAWGLGPVAEPSWQLQRGVRAAEREAGRGNPRAHPRPGADALGWSQQVLQGILMRAVFQVGSPVCSEPPRTRASPPLLLSLPDQSRLRREGSPSIAEQAVPNGVCLTLPRSPWISSPLCV